MYTCLICTCLIRNFNSINTDGFRTEMQSKDFTNHHRHHHHHHHYHHTTSHHTNTIHALRLSDLIIFLNWTIGSTSQRCFYNKENYSLLRFTNFTWSPKYFSILFPTMTHDGSLYAGAMKCFSVKKAIQDWRIYRESCKNKKKRII